MKIRPTRILYAILSLAFILMMGMGHLSAKVTSPAITTLAGSGSAGFGDGTGSGASFKDPSALAVDTVGNVYVADTQNNRIRKITPAGVVSTLAGSGVAGFSDGKGKSASFKSPTGIALDSSGNVYVADWGNNRLRKITPAGVVTTLLSSTDSKFKPHGVALDSSGNIYVADKQNNKIHKITIPVFPSAMVSVVGGKLPKSSKLKGQVVKSFEIGKYEVTWGEWKTVRDWAVSNGYTDLAEVGDTYPSGSADNFPVTSVSWYDVVKWSNARSEKEGKTPVYKNGKGGTYKTGEVAPTLSVSANGYRLPSEKEWEWAARGGVSSQGYTYSGSNTVSEVGWTYENSSDGTKAVGTKAANELGMYDMSGNVLEWCEDVYDPYPSGRRIRGGSWDSFADDASVAYRDINYYPGGRDGDFGFRLARRSGN